MIKRKTTIILAALLAVLSCVKQKDVNAAFSGKDVKFEAEIEDTRTSLSSDSFAVLWTQHDAISVLDGKSNVLYRAEQSGAPAIFGSETGIADGTQKVWAVYPYSEENALDGSGVAVCIPAVQNVQGSGCDPAASLCVAFSDRIERNTGLSFMNVCSYLSFSVSESDRITDVEIQGARNEPIAGKVRLSLSKDGEPQYKVVDGCTKVVLHSSVPVNGDCMIALVPSVLQDGFTVTLRAQDGRVAEHKVTAKDSESGAVTAVNLLRGKINRRILRLDDLSWEKHTVPEVEAVNTFWSDSYIRWTCSEEPEGYSVSVDGVPYATVAATASECHIKGLEPGKTYSVVVTAHYKHASSDSEPLSVRTGSISQIVKNLSPTSVSVAIENRAGDNTSNDNPCLFIELYDGPDAGSANLLRSAYIIDAQIYCAGSPFFGGLVVDSKKSRAPLNVAFGSLSPGTDYYLRVRSVARYEFVSYYTATPARSFCESSNGDSDFSALVRLSTPQAHSPADGEILYLGFDELMLQADYVNCAVGSVPAFKAAGKKVTDMTLETVRDWTGEWSFYGLRTAYASTQLAPQYAWGTQQTVSDGLFTLSNQLVTGTAPGKGAKIYRFKDWTGDLQGWISSNNTYPCQGYIQLGYYYDVSDARKQNVGMLVSPAVENGLPQGGAALSCTLSFNALVLQGRTCALGIWVYDAAAGTWSKAASEDLYNSAGLKTAASEWSALSDTHRWYAHSLEIGLKYGDRIAFETDKEGAVLIDEIKIVTNR